jgi:hypothetical protein
MLVPKKQSATAFSDIAVFNGLIDRSCGGEEPQAKAALPPTVGQTTKKPSRHSAFAEVIQIKAGISEPVHSCEARESPSHPAPTEESTMDDEVRGKILTLLDQHRIMTICHAEAGWLAASDNCRLRKRRPYALLSLRSGQPKGGELGARRSGLADDRSRHAPSDGNHRTVHGGARASGGRPGRGGQGSSDASAEVS